MAEWRQIRLDRLPVYVCICNGVTEREIRQAAQAGCSGIAELTMRTGCGACCGSCVPMACEILDSVQRDAVHGETRAAAAANVLAFPRIASAA